MTQQLLFRHSIPTPVLVIDLDALERNIATMAAFAARSGIKLRPHVKSHKCVAIARRQVDAGAIGMSCATLDEVAALIEGGIEGLLLTSPIAGEGKLAWLAHLLHQDPTLMVVADNPDAVDELNSVASRVAARLRVLVDVDVGQRRTGCRGLDEAVALAKHIQAATSLTFAGIQGYAGHIQHIPTLEGRRAAAGAVAEHLRKLCELLSQEGLPPGIVTGAGTGSAPVDATLGVYTELQTGSYVFMDTEYLAVAGLGERFLPALFVDTTVVGEQWAEHVTTDAGTKAFALNGPPPRAVLDEAGWTYSYQGDEFGRISLTQGARRPVRGERLAFIVSHCDPTVVLYPRYVCVRENKIQDYWPIVARRGPG